MIAALSVDKVGSFKIPFYTNFVYWKFTYPNGIKSLSPKPGPVPENLGLMPFAVVTTLFAFMSAIAHFIVLMNKEKYLNDLRRGINYFRWYEYSISSSLMIGNSLFLNLLIFSFDWTTIWNL